jgi:hypothetical protein
MQAAFHALRRRRSGGKGKRASGRGGAVSGGVRASPTAAPAKPVPIFDVRSASSAVRWLPTKVWSNVANCSCFRPSPTMDADDLDLGIYSPMKKPATTPGIRALTNTISSKIASWLPGGSTSTVALDTQTLDNIQLDRQVRRPAIRWR